VIETLIFYTLALFLLGGSLGMILNKNTVFSAASFMLAMIALAGMYALLHQSFLFLAQILVAVGAVVTLSLLVIVSVNLNPKFIPDEPHRGRWLLIATLLSLPIVGLLIAAVLKSNLAFAPLSEGFGTLKATGAALFSKWVLPFELVSILLLIAMVAGIIISRRKGSYDA
jgi:NADH-quinone oxidoreductase subunit J